MPPIGGIGAGMGGISIPQDLLDKLGSAGKVGGAEKLGGAGGGVDQTQGASGASSFADMLKDKLGALNESQADAGRASEDMATGRVDDVAQTMLRIEQANVSLKMATQVRNKVIESYQEIMRMQV